MVLGQNFYCKMILKYLNVRIIPDLFDKRLFNGLPCFVLCMEYPVFGMSSFLCKIVSPILLFIERNTKVYQVLYTCRSFMNNKPYNFLIAYSVAGYQCIPYMLFKIIGFTEYSCNPTLCITCARIIENRLCNNRHFPVPCRFKRKGKTCDT